MIIHQLGNSTLSEVKENDGSGDSATGNGNLCTKAVPNKSGARKKKRKKRKSKNYTVNGMPEDKVKAVLKYC